MSNLKESFGTVQAVIEGSRILKKDLEIALCKYKNYQDAIEHIENNFNDIDGEISLNENSSLITCFSSTILNTRFFITHLVESNLIFLSKLDGNYASNNLRYQPDIHLDYPQENFRFNDFGNDIKYSDEIIKERDFSYHSPRFDARNTYQMLNGDHIYGKYDASASPLNHSTNKRGPYRKYNKNTKLNAIIRVKAGEDIRKVSKEIQIPIKNIKRWLEFGPDRKKGFNLNLIIKEEEGKHLIQRWKMNFMTGVSKNLKERKANHCQGQH